MKLQDLKKGEQFTIEGLGVTFTFSHMDGLYCLCYHSGEEPAHFMWGTDVELVPNLDRTTKEKKGEV